MGKMAVRSAYKLRRYPCDRGRGDFLDNILYSLYLPADLDSLFAGVRDCGLSPHTIIIRYS
jgi:hypothetical protein